MSCFSLAFIEQLCIWLIVVCAIVAQIINIVLWAVVAILCVYIIFALLSCLLGSGGGLMHFPR